MTGMVTYLEVEYPWTSAQIGRERVVSPYVFPNLKRRSTKRIGIGEISDEKTKGVGLGLY